MSVSAGGDVYGIPISGNAKVLKKPRLSFKIFLPKIYVKLQRKYKH